MGGIDRGDTDRRWLPERRPRGDMRDDDFRWDEQDVPEPGKVVMQVELLSCDHTQRGWIDGTRICRRWGSSRSAGGW